MRVRIVLLGGWLALTASARVEAAEPVEVRVPATRTWTETAIQLQQGQPLRIEASGRVHALGWTWKDYLFGHAFDRVVGPEGTYVWPRDYPTRSRRGRRGRFPLAAGQDGPHPAFGLIAKIGADGAPFYVGRAFAGLSSASGSLWVGVNDDDVSDNRGAFQARIQVGGELPALFPIIPKARLDAEVLGQPVPQARVLLLYVDGLRPDVVHEMADAGFLPNVKATFLDQGLECANAVTTVPSNTLIANGSLFTGLFPDRTGIKSQNQFERSTLLPRGPLSEWLPDWLMIWSTPQTQIIDLLDKFAPENTHQFLVQRGVPTLASRLSKAYRFTVLPIMPTNPPPRWLHRALNAIENPFAASVQIPVELDRANAASVIEDIVGDPEARVITAWFPMVDKICHHSARGQFGPARREVAVFDRLLGRILARLREVGWDRSTYLILVSDHGHLGGKDAVNRRANLARDLFHRRLGCNVRVVGQQWTFPGLDPDRFVFLDPQGAGQAAIFLPKGSYHHGGWHPNRLVDLMRYDLGPNRAPINLLHALSEFTGEEWTPEVPKPVDLVLMRLDAARILVYRSEDNQALIHVSVGGDGIERYRYEPIRRIEQAEGGTITTQPPLSRIDPLGVLADSTVTQAVGGEAALYQWMQQAHDAQEWLSATVRSEYPDAVVGIAKFFQWKPPVQDLAEVRTPDLLVTAARGWSFRSDDEWGTDHGSPIREAMRISLFVAGPHIRHGTLEAPHRIIDVLPTMLEMVGWPHDPQELDGRAIRGIYYE